MIRNLFKTGFIVALAGIAFLSGAGELEKLRARKRPFKSIFAENKAAKIAPNQESRSFAFVVYAHNASYWCEKALRSILEQDYEHYRILFVDDGSSDGTFEKAQQYISESRQGYRFFATRNETPIGPIGCLYRAADGCHDREILVPLDASNWLVHEGVLSRLNCAFQDPDVWISIGQAIDYPSYRMSPPIPGIQEIQNRGLNLLENQEAPALAFYAGVFKSIELPDLAVQNRFSPLQSSYLIPLFELSGGRLKYVSDPWVFANRTGSRVPHLPLSLRISPGLKNYRPLAEFPPPSPAASGGVDLVLLSRDSPIRLYACLESILRSAGSVETISVLYSASDGRFQSAYEQVKAAFPDVRYLEQGAFKDHLLQAVFESPSDYVLLSCDDAILSNFVDLGECCRILAKTKASKFSLVLGRGMQATRIELNDHVVAFDPSKMEDRLVDMAIYSKEKLKSLLQQEKYADLDSLEERCKSRRHSKRALGLYFESAKAMHLPISSDSIAAEDLLAKFNRGLKIDLEPFANIDVAILGQNYSLEFVPR